MKYGESAFDVLYLIFVITAGVIMLCRRRDGVRGLMGLAALVLGFGDAFHLIPRVIRYFSDTDLTPWLGFGKLVTSLTMTVFYILLYRICIAHYGLKESTPLTLSVYLLALLRGALCIPAQNGWFTGDGELLWGVWRNLPFLALGALVTWLYWKNRKTYRPFRLIWLWITLSFLFYIPVAVAAPLVPMLGMLMLPKTVCYVILIWTFFRYVTEKKDTAADPQPAM